MRKKTTRQSVAIKKQIIEAVESRSKGFTLTARERELCMLYDAAKDRLSPKPPPSGDRLAEDGV